MPLRHNEYYMQDGDVIFLVEDTLFKIHKRLLTRNGANFFVTILKSSQTEGETDETPIELDGNSVEDFEGLMRLLYPRFLEEPSLIPVRILVHAMRIATKYFMDEEQAAIVRVIQSRPFASGIIEAIAILCFIAEFPEYFRKDYAQAVFDQACSTSYYPSTEDLEPLMYYPHLLVAMMKYREGKLNPAGAIWNPNPNPEPFFLGPVVKGVITPMDEWLDVELDSLRLNNE